MSNLMAFNVEIVEGKNKGVKGYTFAIPNYNSHATIFSPISGKTYYEKADNIKYGESFVSNKIVYP